MPVIFVSKTPAPSALGSAALGLAGALEAFVSHKKEERAFKLKQDEALRAADESKQMRQFRDMQMSGMRDEQERKATEERIQEEAERAALGRTTIGAGGEDVVGTMPITTRSGGSLAELASGASKPAPIDLSAGMPAAQPAAPLAGMINPQAVAPAPPTAPASPNRSLADINKQLQSQPKVEQGALSLMGTLPKGPLDPSQRAAGRTSLVEEARQKDIAEKKRVEDVSFKKEAERERAADERQAASLKQQAELQEKNNEAHFKRAELAARRASAAADAKNEKEQFNQEKSIRGTWESTRRKPKENLAQMDRYSGSVNEKLRRGERPSAADQYGLVYAFNKALDPTSVVRESEFANTTKVAASYVDRAYRYYQQVVKGEMLTDRQIAEMMEVINEGRSQAKAEVDGIDERYYSIAVNNRLSPERIFGSAQAASGQAAANPGNPADLNLTGTKAAGTPGNSLGLKKPGTK